ncbi:MAG TPA: endonuclease/exonuclease/phosphatase family protein [Williamwhitmania sp.]|nr:endonuclease/exonuclease/phosphatase family protein [Williamwhitmania sp.]
MRNLLLIIFLILITIKPSFAQNQGRVNMLWYNTENLFDPFDDSLTVDDEFTMAGARHWTWAKMEKKLDGIYKVIVASFGFEPPLIVGLCEVENRFVLNRLVYETPLSKFEYRVLHAESPDARGIDVALLYRSKRLWLKQNRFIRSYPPQGHRSRDILYAKFLLDNTDTLHLFLNHWPSKYGGELETEKARAYAATMLSTAIDSVLIRDSLANIVVMGDFNDDPDNNTIQSILKFRFLDDSDLGNTKLVNLSKLFYANGIGTHKYQGHWAVIDQVMVSNSFFAPYNALSINPESCRVFAAPFLLEPDEQYTGMKPFRTFVGFKYHGGYSDHLPVLLTIDRRF